MKTSSVITHRSRKLHNKTQDSDKQVERDNNTVIDSADTIERTVAIEFASMDKMLDDLNHTLTPVLARREAVQRERRSRIKLSYKCSFCGARVRYRDEICFACGSVFKS